MFYIISAEAITWTKADKTEIIIVAKDQLNEKNSTMCSEMCLSGTSYLKEKKKHCSISASLWVVLPALFSKTFLSLGKWRNQWKGMWQRIDMNKNTKNGGPLSVQPSSLVVFSSRSSSLSTSLWSLLAMVFLLLSSLVPFFFSWIGKGFTDYKERKQDEYINSLSSGHLSKTTSWCLCFNSHLLMEQIGLQLCRHYRCDWH